MEKHLRYSTLATLLIAILSACTQSVTLQVDSTVPQALVQKIPLTVGVYYDSSLRNHVYEEDSTERQKWSIATGNSQVAMFDQVLTTRFERIVILDKPPQEAGPVKLDFSIAPTLSDMQFSIPEETRFKFYEAWMSYSLRLFDANGQALDNWGLTAYGKAPQKRFTARTEALNRAIEFALRDIGAKLSTGLRNHPVVLKALAKQ